MEIFKDVKQFEDTYEVSNYGRVRNKKTGHMKVPALNHKGYHYVNLYYGSGKYTKWYIHRLVAVTFIPNPEHKGQVNHKDGNKLNNYVGNLEWCSNEENMTHAVRNNLRCHGERVHFHRFTEEQVRMFPTILACGISVYQLCKIVNLKSTISMWNIIYGKYWKHLKLKFPYIRYGRLKKDEHVYLPYTVYLFIIENWGNTVLNSMIAKGQIKIV